MSTPATARRPQPYRHRRLPRLLAFLALAMLLGCKELGIQAEPPPTIHRALAPRG